MSSTQSIVLESNIKDAYAVFLHCRKQNQDLALFESLGKGDGRFSIAGLIPQWKLVSENKKHADPKQAEYVNVQTGQKKHCNWLDELNGLFLLQSQVTMPQLGVMGYIGYEKRHCFETLLSTKGDAQQDTQIDAIPDLYLVFYSLMYWYDNQTGNAYWVFDESVRQDDVDIIRNEILATTGTECIETFPKFFLKGDVYSEFSQTEHATRVQKAVEYIRQGDIFQANITERFYGEYSGDPIHLYDRLRQETPNPFFAYLDFEKPIISTSPERFFKIEGQDIVVMPIKGTRNTGSAEKKQENSKQLLASSKDAAENSMIVDLMRNDLGRVCEKGSVEVRALCELIECNKVFHLQSTVRGRVRSEVRFSDILAALFPCGSITGAPKIRTMDIIEELEANPRKVYCGCIGFIGNSYADTSVAIRIIQFTKDRFFFHAGGGIVVDSQPEEEYQELFAKVDGIKQSIISFDILGKFRQEIDALDRELIELLAKRFTIIRTVSDFKEKYKVAVVQKERMREVVEKVVAYAKECNVPEDIVQSFYTTLVAYSTNLEAELQDRVPPIS